MAFWNRKKTPEQRATIESPSAPVSEQRATIESPSVPIFAANIIGLFGADSVSATGVLVNIDDALGVPAVWAAVNFLSGTIAGLPLKAYQKTEGGREAIEGGISSVLHDAVNEETTSFDWRKYTFERVFTGGRGVTFIERNAAGRIISLWPLDPQHVTVSRRDGKKRYTYRPPNGRQVTYDAVDIIDLTFMLKSDGVTAISPILKNKDAIGLAIAATNYGSKFFNNGGVPPHVMTGPFSSGAALNRASNDMQASIISASAEGKLVLAIPSGHELKPIGSDPEKSQLVELKRFQIEEIARIYSLPPAFLQDLTRGTFSNTEQQDLHLVKHTIKRWIEQAEQELNLKLFGRGSNKIYVEFTLDGLLRGDFVSRMSGYATSIQNGIMTPNEVRRQENRPDDPNGNELLIQGATVPLGSQPTAQPTPKPPEEVEDDKGN